MHRTSVYVTGFVLAALAVATPAAADPCPVATPPGTPCILPPGQKPLITAVSTSTTDVGLEISYLTPRGPSSTSVKITGSTNAAVRMVPRSASDTASLTHSLSIAGLAPSTTYTFEIYVDGTLAHSGRFATAAPTPVKIETPPMVRIVYPAVTVNVPVTIVAPNRPIKDAALTLDNHGWKISMPPTTVTLAPNEKRTVNVLLTIPDIPKQSNNANANMGEATIDFALAYEKLTTKSADFKLRTYNKSQQIETKYYDPPSCKGVGTGFALFYPSGIFDLQFSFDIDSYSDDPSKAVLFTMSWKGKTLARGVFPKTPQSTVYSSAYTQTSKFRTTYTGGDYTNLYDDYGWKGPNAISFSCQEVPASTVLK